MSEYQITQECSLHKYRTEIPNIIFDLDLDAYDKIVYLTLKRIAGDKGACFMTLDNLAKACGMSVTQVKKSKKNLSKEFDLLEKKPLITISRRKKPNGSCDTDLITIKDIWADNFKYFLGGGAIRLGVGRIATEGQAQYDPKEELSKEDPSKEKERISSLSPLKKSFEENKEEDAFAAFCPKDLLEEPVEVHPNVKLTKDQVETLRMRCQGHEKILQCAYEALSEWKLKKNITNSNDFKNLSEWGLEAGRKKHESSLETKMEKVNVNVEFIKSISKRYPNHPHLVYGDTYLEVTAGQSYDRFDIAQFGFKEMVVNRLRKMNIYFKEA